MTRLEIAKAITALRRDLLAAVIPSTAAEIAEEIDVLLGMWDEAS